MPHECGASSNHGRSYVARTCNTSSSAFTGSPAYAGDDGGSVALSLCHAIARRRRCVPAMAGAAMAGGASAWRLARDLRRRNARTSNLIFRYPISLFPVVPRRRPSNRNSFKRRRSICARRASIVSPRAGGSSPRSIVTRSHALKRNSGCLEMWCWPFGRAKPTTVAISFRMTPSACWRHRLTQGSARISSVMNSCTL